MHDADASQLYVDVVEPLAERARLKFVRPDEEEDDGSGAARRPSPPHARIGEAESQLEQELRSGYRVVVTFTARARPNAPATTSTGSTRSFARRAADRRRRRSRAPAERVFFAESPLSEGFVAAGPQARGDPVPAPRPPPPRRGAVAGARADDVVRRPAGRRLRRPRGPRHRPLRRLRDEDARRRHPRLPRARVPRRGQGLLADRPAREDHPLRRRRRRRAAALGARLEALGRDQVARPPRRPRARGRAAQPLRRAPGAQRATRSAPTASGSSSSSRASPTARRPTRSRRSRRSRATWSPSGRWTG